MIRRLLLAMGIAVSANAYAGGGMTGGATEVTQLMNNAELAAQTAENARQTATQLSQLYTALENVKSYGDLAAVEQKMGLPPGTLRQAADNLGSVKKLRITINGMRLNAEDLSERSKALYAIFRAALKTYEKTGRKPTEVMEEMAKRDDAEAKAYKKQAEYTRQQIEQTIKDVDSIKKQADGVPTITGSVKGLQYIAGQNVTINQSLKEINLTLLEKLHADQVARQREAEMRKQQRQEAQAKAEAEAARGDRITQFGNSAWDKLKQ